MLGRLTHWLARQEAQLRNSFGRDITDPRERRRSEWHLDWLDHGILRRHWHNFEEFAPGAYRSNHPDRLRFERYARLGIRSVLNLRGAVRQPHYLFEQEWTEALGLTLVDVHMSARQAPRREALLALMEAFDTIERPFLMHCKSGADRTGLAAAIYLLRNEGAPLEVARRQLSFRYIHIRRTSTGILDHFLDTYAARLEETGPIGIEQWIRTEYDPTALTESFEAKQAALKPWEGWR